MRFALAVCVASILTIFTSAVKTDELNKVDRYVIECFQYILCLIWIIFMSSDRVSVNLMLKLTFIYTLFFVY